MRRRDAAVAFVAAAGMPWGTANAATAASTTTAAPATPFGPPQPDAGWCEAVLVVSDLQRMVRVLDTIAGWQLQSHGNVPAAVLRLWGLPPGVTATEALLGNAGDRSGFVRLLQFQGAVGAQQQIRSSAMPWDTGGIFSLMTRSRDLDGAFARAQALGYSAFNDPVDFDFGGVVLRNVVLRLPDGINIAIYERRKPLLQGWDTMRKLSLPFNAMQMVADRDRTRDFYSVLLGYTPLADATFLDPAPGPNNFALPQNLATTAERRFAIMAVAGAETGRVEAMQFAGLTGRDLSERARMPNLGIAALRFPTRRLDAIVQAARDRGHAVGDTVATTLAPYGSVRLALLRSPDGVAIELMQLP